MRSPSKIVAVTPAAIEIEKRAIEREKKGQFRIAAHLWLQCMDVASGDVERARIAKRYSPAIHFSNFDGENGIRSVCSPLIQESIISAHCCNM
ncbi:transcriptional regulator [Escherichia coli]|uniref:transcriptional regulator n=1 Tax=Escherichia coli TaxID=562 RepID=UPI0039648C07